MTRTIAMGDPRYFSVRGGANPHTRNWLGLKKRVNAKLARQQWHQLARVLLDHGVDVLVIPPNPKLTGLVYPANAGFLYPLSARDPNKKTAISNLEKRFYLSNLVPTRAGERDVYRSFMSGLGYQTQEICARFEGEADFFPAGDFMLFTYGRIEKQRFVLRWGLPPWRRIYGFRSSLEALSELSAIAKDRPILPLELILETHYHGDTALCSFGPQRRFLLAFLEALSEDSRQRLKAAFGENLIPISRPDGELYAANAFPLEHEGRFYLFMPQGVSQELLVQIRQRGVEPVCVNVSEFMAKGGGSVKCMILDLGPSDEQPEQPAARSFREKHRYLNLFG